MNKNIINSIFNHPYVVLAILIVLEAITIIIDKVVTQSDVLRLATIVLKMAVAIGFFVSIVHLVNQSLKNLLKPRSFLHLMESYALLVIGIIILFSSIYNFLEFTNTGYLSYGMCKPGFNATANPEAISHDYTYFSATTFFTVGYGDVCPIKISKLFATLEAFTGNIISVILMGLIINNYLMSRRRPPRRIKIVKAKKE